MNIERDITKTVYSICWPETKKIFEELNTTEMSDIYLETWSKKQDSIHFDFKSSFEFFAQDKTNLDFSEFPFFYPTNGSSEAIREEICYLHSLGKKMIVFKGEYEGYFMIAKAIKMPYFEINREFWQEELKDFSGDDFVFFLSQPSSIDGCIFSSFNEFMDTLQHKNILCCLDITYFASTPYKNLSLNHDNILTIFFSLSKLFGVYYHRIGGCYRKSENPLLYGNMWFKNLFSIKYGQTLMSSIDFDKLRNDLKNYQAQSIEHINQKIEDFCGFSSCIEKSDVFLLGIISKQKMNDYLETLPFNSFYWNQTNIVIKSLNDNFTRNESDFWRVCVSPVFEKLIYKKQ